MFFVERLDGGFVLDEGDDLVSVAGFGSPLGDDNVSVQNARVDHTFALDAQREVGFVGRHGAIEGDIAFDLFDGEDGLTGGDGAEERDLSGLGLRQADVQVDVPLEAGVSRDVAGLFQRVQVALNGGRGLEADRGADLADGGRDDRRLCPLEQVRVDALLSLVEFINMADLLKSVAIHRQSAGLLA